MGGKYESIWRYAVARVQRVALRALLRPLVRWPRRAELRSGCTAIIGMCSRLPDVIDANVTCLRSVRWPDLVCVVIAVDGLTGCLAEGTEQRVQAILGDLPCEFIYYSRAQARTAELVQLPYVYSWLSWAIAISRVRTETLLIHDYDALLLTGAVADRYRAFRSEGAVVQGVRWYDSNGILKEDRLATTFEAFVDMRWLLRFNPIRMFQQIGRLLGRSVDFDTLLELQAHAARPEQRSVIAMKESDLTHPSQMIHQYTMFRRDPAGELPCYSLPMIPFFSWLGGREDALRSAVERLRDQPPQDVQFFADGVRVNLTSLRVDHVDWLLKQMLQACVSLGKPPTRDLVDFGERLYAIVAVPADERWRNNFLPDQIAWFESARG